MTIQVKQIEMDEGATHLEGYKLGFNDAYLQLVDQVNSLVEMKAEYDRAFCIVRHAGIQKQATTKLSTAVSLLIARQQTTLILLEKEIEQCKIKKME